MLFLLSEKDIKAILMQGKFEEDKYLDNTVVGSWYIGSSINEYLEEHEEEKYRKFKEYFSNEKNKEEVCKRLQETFYLTDFAYEEMENCMNQNIEKMINNWEKETNK
ncbi:hypothetical protein [uncultured Fusobacterium sp.]|uniref:hypothetical protein n=1 Tax=uncultured Fusobacterium sp. TaxID=159267 RepID=UPI0015A6FCB1|nr:hypothetical protein [uncultured Fusobacterium sp.]